MKRIMSVLLSAVLVVSVFFSRAQAVVFQNANVVPFQVVTNSAQLKFSKKFGANYRNSPTPPIVVGDTLIVASGSTLYKLNAENGEVTASVKMSGSNFYATVSPLYADGKIFVQLDGGKVEAFDYESLKSLWTYTDSLGGQALCPIIYDGENIYTGFWNGETENANYVCLKAECENAKNTAVWKYESLGGFYWVGCAVSGNYAVLGKDDGARGSDGKSSIVLLNKANGKCVSSLNVKGDIRSSVSYSDETQSYYTSSKAGYVYKFKVDTEKGKLNSLKTYTASGAITATPIVYNNRLYVGSQNGSGGKFNVLDATELTGIYSCDMNAYVQSTALVCTGYEQYNGKVYVIVTYNAKPGGLTVFEDSAGQTKAEKTELFTPENAMSEYCISTVSASEDGTLYYKNDSGNIFAVSQKIDNAYLFQNFFKILQKLLDIVLGMVSQ